jgi:hypothetical protein
MRTDEKCWFEFDPDSEEETQIAVKALNGTVTTLENEQAGRTHDMIKLMSIYINRDLRAMSAYGGSLLNSMPLAIRNVLKSIVDTLVAKFVTNESKATFDVDDGDFNDSMKAQNLDRFCFGEVYRLKLYEKNEIALLDAARCGDGWVKFYARDKKVFAERVFPVEMRLDPAQCVSGPPRDLWQIRYIARHQAMAYYNDFADQIEKLPREQPPYPYPGTPRDIVRLVEAWHLPDSDDGEGGRYMLACGDVLLRADKYTRKDFPFVRFTWNQNPMGGYGIGLAEELVPLQSELNKLKARHLKGLHIHGLPRVFMAAGSELDPEELTNSPVQIWRYTGQPPQTDLSPCVAPELVAEEEALVNQMWQLAGVSPLQAGTDMPSRMDSRPGLREYAALSDEKHAMPSKAWDRGILDGNRHIIAIAREIVAEHGNYEAMGAAKDFINTLDFKDCDLEDERFRIKLQNTNLLPTTPAGKRLGIKDLADAGAFDDDKQALWTVLAGAPDIDAVIGDKTAGQQLVKKQVYVMMEKQKYFGPDKTQDAAYARKFVNNAMQRLLLQTNGLNDKSGKPDKKVVEIYNLLDRYSQDCDDILQAAIAEQQAQMMAAQPAQPGAMNGPGGPAPSPGIDPNAGAGAGPPAGIV